MRRAAALAFLCTAPLFAGSQVTARKAALATASPYATKAGLEVMRRGGNAADAAVAVAFTLAVASPQGGNIGGGGYLVYYDAATHGVWTLDFSEVAPAAAKHDMFAGDANAARTGPRAVAVPGTVAGLAALQTKFGSQRWKDLLEPAIALAREGVPVSAELSAALDNAQRERKIDAFPATAAAFFEEGKPRKTLVQTDLAATLRRIADGGAREFYEGQTATRLVNGLREAGGILGYRDLREYQPLWRAPIQLTYRDYDIYSVAPPSGGGIVIGETLNILSGYDLAAAGFQTPAALHLLVEAERRAYIDRNKYVADPSGTRIPYRELLSSHRAADWRKTIDPKTVVATAQLTEPSAIPVEHEHTTHFTIVDTHGNIAAVTVSLGDDFGSGVVVPGLGFLLNNAMDDFSIAAEPAPNRDDLVQGMVNAIEPGKRVASSMSPTLVMRGGKPYLALGSPGGPSIPTTILQVFLDMAVYGKTLAAAVDAPRYHHQGLPEDLDYERGLAPQTTIDALNRMGHGVSGRDSIGDVQAIAFVDGALVAVSDSRHGGAAGGF